MCMLSSPNIPYHVGIEEFSTLSETTRTRFSKVIIWQIPLYCGIDLTNKVVERSSTFLQIEVDSLLRVIVTIPNRDRHYSIIRRVHRISLTTDTRIIIREAISNGCPLTYISREIADRTRS
jgi:hypothetical protein